LNQELAPLPAPDEFDNWSMDRERRENSMVSARYVPRDMIGYEDLDAYGVWRNVPPYGWVWTPTNVPARLGAVSRGPLGLGTTLGLDVDR
jgi:hypothetical protein